MKQLIEKVSTMIENQVEISENDITFTEEEVSDIML
jgi:hypothetical protein